jgi:ABC-type Fe3+/spermidine/putrescine transport system ATPase subunit
VTKRFGDALAVDHVSLDIPRGTFATLLGPSGCGKTTTLRMIAGFHDPDEGSIYLSGRRLNELPAHRRGTAMVFQDYALFPHMTVRNNVAYGLKLGGVSRADRERRVRETLEFVGLGRLADRYPGQLSGGQQQRVALGRALVIEPEVLLLDEPLSNLDARLREQLRWELRAMQKRLDMTFVYVTHDQEEALSMSDWVAVMNEGRVEQAGPPAEVYYRPQTVFTAGFVGTVNLVTTRVVRAEADCLTVSLDGRELAIPGVHASGEQVQLCIRPETLGIGPGAQGGPFTLHGTVARSAFLGDLRRYWVEVGESEWIVDVPDPGAELLQGPVEISVRPERVHVIAQA